MAVVGDNSTNMSSCDTYRLPVALARDVRIRFNLEFLKGCAFNCDGCFVNRMNTFSERDLDVVYEAKNQFIDAGYVFDEIILGPTDFFGAFNTVELLQNPKFIRLFDSNPVLTLLSTLQTNEEEIKERIKLVNEKLGNSFEIEILIPIEISKILDRDPAYVQSLKEKLKLLNLFECDVEYAMQINIQDISQYKNFSLKGIANFIWEEFGTITEFNPSFLRSKNYNIAKDTITSWNKTLEEHITRENILEDKITFTMANPNHAGFNEITYNFHKGEFYTCPFIYENVFDRSPNFKISPSGDSGFYHLDDFLKHRFQTDKMQMEYLKDTKECADCVHSMSCVSKQVIDYMKDKGLTECILAKSVLDLYERA